MQQRRPTTLPPGLAATVVFIAAAAVLVIEIAALRLIAPYVGVTLQTNTAVIGAALGAIAFGAWTGGRVADRTAPSRLLGPLLLLAAGLAMLTLPVVRWAGELTRGTDASAVLLLAMLAVFAPAALLSAVTPMVVKTQLQDLRETGTIVGRMSGIGTLGAILGTFATGFLLVAMLPTTAIILGVGAIVAITGGVVLWQQRRAVRIDTRARVPPATFALLPISAALLGLAPNPCDVETAYHCAKVVADSERPSGRILRLDTYRHSYVDLTDPTYLDFKYIQAIASMADVFRPSGAPVAALHIGGGGATIPRYLAATRPGGRDLVLEIDEGVVELDRSALGLRTGPSLSVRVGDARTALDELPSAEWDLVVGDAFGGLAVPWHLTTREFVEQIRRVLRPDGVYAMNLIDHPPDGFARAGAATLRAVFPYVILAAAPDTVAGTGGGNHVLVASESPLPVDVFAARLAEHNDWVVADAAETAAYADGAQILTDDFAPVDQLVSRY